MTRRPCYFDILAKCEKICVFLFFWTCILRVPIMHGAGPGQAKWQGPALYVHNDATFSPDDFKSISKIGQEGKLDKANATGMLRNVVPASIPTGLKRYRTS